MKAAFVSFRCSEFDGVSVEAAKWRRVLDGMGIPSFTVAGAGDADCVLPGLAIGAGQPPTEAEVSSALAAADLVVVENVCSLPLNPGAASVLAAVLRGRPTVLHHHDLPWQRERFAGVPGFPPDDPAWLHVTINHLSRAQLAERGIRAHTVHNCFDTAVAPGDGEQARRRMGIAAGARVLLHPTRAIPRKNVPAALDLAAGLDATYWLLGPAEDGYEPELRRVLGSAAVPVVHGMAPELTVADAYAAADAVTLPSTWEGFGNATVESAIHRRPLALGRYPVAREIAAFGFRWFPAERPGPLSAWLDRPDIGLLETNRAIAAHHLSLEALARRLSRLLEGHRMVAPQSG